MDEKTKNDMLKCYAYSQYCAAFGEFLKNWLMNGDIEECSAPNTLQGACILGIIVFTEKMQEIILETQ